MFDINLWIGGLALDKNEKASCELAEMGIAEASGR
jgi:hypothetical protein